MGTLQHQWRTKIKSTHHPPAPTTYSSTKAAQQRYIQHPTHPRTYPPCTPTHHIQQHISLHAQFVAHSSLHAQLSTVSYWDSHVFVISRHDGDRASPSPGVPFHAPCLPFLPVLVFLSSTSPLLCRISLAGRVPCGVAATLAGVISEDLAAVANWRGYQGWDNRFLRLSGRPSSYQDIWSPCALANPGLST